MIYREFELTKYYDLKGGRLTAYLASNPNDDTIKPWKRPAVIVVPGGGYHFCSKREQEAVALEFLARGYHAFVLEYMCAPQGIAYPEPQLELACAIDFVKRLASDFHINREEVFAVGFSAGGHLVACLSTDSRQYEAMYRVNAIDASLTAAGLIYPVISDEYGHIDSHRNLFKNADVEFEKENFHLTCLDRLVNEHTAPAYIFSTFEDKTVPSQNSLSYAMALANAGIKYELHVYPSGGHGMSVATAEVNDRTDGIARNRQWLNDCAEFFRLFTSEPFNP